MGSPSHRANLLNKNYKEIGFAVVNGTLNGYETTLVVQMFGQPRDLSLIASKEESAKTLKEVSTQGVTTVASNLSPEVANVFTSDTTFVDISNVSKYFSILIIGFVLGLLALDIWYSSKHKIFKLTGHTFAHLLVLLFTLFSIWFVLNPGLVL